MQLQQRSCEVTVQGSSSQAATLSVSGCFRIILKSNEGNCEVSLRSSNQQLPGIYMSNAIGSSRESNPSRRICNLHAVPPGYVAITCQRWPSNWMQNKTQNSALTLDHALKENFRDKPAVYNASLQGCSRPVRSRNQPSLREDETASPANFSMI